MELFSLELKVISCRNLKAFNFFYKMSVYAVVSIFHEDSGKRKEHSSPEQRQKTPVDREGGRNPEWNHAVQFDLETNYVSSHVDNLFLRFELRCEGTIFGNRSVGEVRVPFKDLIGDESDGRISTVRYVSYQVRSSDHGKPNGVLNFSYKVKGAKTKNKNGIDSQLSSPAAAVDFSPAKANDHVGPKPEKCRLYPSVDVGGISSSPLSPRPTAPSSDANLCLPFPKQELKNCAWPTPVAALTVEHGTYYYYHHPPSPYAYPSPLLHNSQGPYHWHTKGTNPQLQPAGFQTYPSSAYGSGLNYC